VYDATKHVPKTTEISLIMLRPCSEILIVIPVSYLVGFIFVTDESSYERVKSVVHDATRYVPKTTEIFAIILVLYSQILIVFAMPRAARRMFDPNRLSCDSYTFFLTQKWRVKTV
jgi:Ni,Fe-hydrogenase I cytochrome b subunit